MLRGTTTLRTQAAPPPAGDPRGEGVTCPEEGRRAQHQDGVTAAAAPSRYISCMKFMQQQQLGGRTS